MRTYSLFHSVDNGLLCKRSVFEGLEVGLDEGCEVGCTEGCKEGSDDGCDEGWLVYFVGVLDG